MLTLPDDQTVWVLQTVAQLEAKNSELAQTAVGDGELARSLAGKDMSKRSVFVPRLLVMNDRMPVAEGSTLHVLATEPHMIACRVD